MIIIIYSYIVIYFLQSIVTIVFLIVETILYLFLLYIYIISNTMKKLLFIRMFYYWNDLYIFLVIFLKRDCIWDYIQ